MNSMLIQLNLGQTNSQMLNVHLPNDWRWDGTRKAIIGINGRGAAGPNTGVLPNVSGGADGYTDNWPQADHLRYWVDTCGYAVVVGDLAGGQGHNGPDDQIMLTDVYSFTQNTLKAAVKVGIHGASFGGLKGLTWRKNNASKVGATMLWYPMTDLDFAVALAGYAPSYSRAYIASIYNGNTSGNVPLGGGIPTLPAEIDGAFSRQFVSTSALPGGIASPSAVLTVGSRIPPRTPPTGSFTIGGLTFTYVSWTNNTATGYGQFLGGTSAGSTVPTGTAFTPPGNPGSTDYATVMAGSRGLNDPGGLSHDGHCPTILYHGPDDSVVPSAMSDAYLAQVNDSSHTRRSPNPLGGHGGIQVNIPPTETGAWWQAHL